MKKALLTLAILPFLVSLSHAQAVIRMIQVDPAAETVTLKNLGDAAQDVSSYQLCLGPGQYNILSDYGNITGDLNLEADEELTIDVTSGSENVTALPDAEAGLGLFANTNFGSTSPDDVKDYVQWGAGDQNRVGQAVTAGRWDDAANFIAGSAPYNYLGNATNTGAQWWIDDTAIRMTVVDPIADTVVLQNFDQIERDLSNYFFCTLPGIYPQLGVAGQAEVITGDLSLAPGESVTVQVNSTGAVADTGAIFLFSSPVLGFNNQNPFVTRDFLQWGAPNAFRVENAIAAGAWDDADSFLPGVGPFAYTGDADDLGAAAWQSAADAGGNTFVAELSGSQEVLPVMSTGHGRIQAVLDNGVLTLSGSFDDLIGDFDASIGAHIHAGMAGKNGGVIIPLDPTIDEDLKGGRFEAANNTFELTQGQMDTLRNRGYYINIHTTRNPSGEIRGQLLAGADAYYQANLLGSTEVPAVMSQAFGSLVFELNGDTLTASGAWDDLSSPIAFSVGGGGHIHQEIAGRNGGVIFPLTFTPDADNQGAVAPADSNAFVLDANQLAALDNYGLYINIHSENFMPGEIRGQILPIASSRFIIELSANQEVLPQLSFAHGKLVATLDSNNTVTLGGSYNELESDLNVDILGGAHIHGGLAGVNGPVQFVLTPDADDTRNGAFNTADNSFTLTEAQVDSLLARQYYVNVHSLNIPSGEIRGQILPEAQIYMLGQLSGSQEVQPVISQGAGTIVTEVLGANLTFSGAVRGIEAGIDTNIVGGMHLHRGMAGENGPVEIPLAIDTKDELTEADLQAADNRYAVSQGFIDTIRGRGAYFNVHSFENGAGEVRGQLLPYNRATFYSNLAGAHEIPAANSIAFGAVTVEYTGSNLIFSGRLSGLSSPIATEILGGGHLHLGDAGANGPVRIPLNLAIEEGMTAARLMAPDNVFGAEGALLDSLRKRQTYVNIHSDNFQAGEIRGQVLPYAPSVFTTSLSGANEVPSLSSNGAGGMKLELRGQQVIVTGSFSGLDSDYEVNIGSHIHDGDASENGPVLITLAPELGEELRSGQYLIDSNVFMLDEAQAALMEQGDLYINIHSVNNPTGELRGQILNDANQFPTSTTVFSPENGAEVDLNDPTLPFEASWNASEDADGDLLVYTFELGADSAFTDTLFRNKVGADTLFATTFGTVDTLLAGNGVAPGANIALWHRVIASDGSVRRPGEAKLITLIRDESTALNERFADDLSMTLSPVPFRDRLTMAVNSDISGASRSVLYNLNGQVLQSREFNLNNGQNTVQFDLANLSPGVYVVSLFIEGELAGFQKVVKE